MIIDAKNLILGRMASYAAKKALLGESISVVNCGQAVLTGNRKNILEKYFKRINFGQPNQGPYMQRRPDKFVRRVIRGMLPWRHPRGREVFKRVKCYIGVPEEFKDKKIEIITNANVAKLSNYRYISVNELCQQLGGRKW